MSKADEYLWSMKEKADSLARDDGFREILSWAREKAASVRVGYKPAAVRGYYIYLALALNRGIDLVRDLVRAREIDFDLVDARDIELVHGIDCDLDHDLNFALMCDDCFGVNPAIILLDIDGELTGDAARTRLDLFNATARTRSHTRKLDLSLDLALALDLVVALELAQEMERDSLLKSLEKLKSQMPLKSASQENLSAWAGRLHEVMIREYNIGHRFELDKEQVNRLKDYLYANKLIVDCLNCQCNVSKSVREQILDTLLIPPNLESIERNYRKTGGIKIYRE